MNRYYSPTLLLLLLPGMACQPTGTTPATTGSIERMDPRLDAIIAPESHIEILAEDFDWSEGPLWIESGGYLLFSDIPPGRVYKWHPTEGKSVYLDPSGYSGETPRDGEKGSNGLLLDAQGRLVLCQHGDRRMAYMDAPLDQPKSEFVTIADRYDGKRFNSPNDAAYYADGDLYFTDPPYGLPKQMEDPGKELDFQGVYRVDGEGSVHLITDQHTRPNGIAFSPDGQKMYVANSDPKRAVWMEYAHTDSGNWDVGKVFFDATDKVGPENKGLPDGLKVDAQGHIFATGPGGVYVFSPDGTQLGLIRTGQATSNCAFGNSGKYLYMTAHMYLMRIALR